LDAPTADLLADFDVFFVGVHCPLEELERRERLRGNRRAGEACADYEVTHTFGQYDYECSSIGATDLLVAQVIKAWAARSQPSGFANMRERLRSAGGSIAVTRSEGTRDEPSFRIPGQR
jgi:chloramphenicol 3-O phosphotransferase